MKKAQNFLMKDGDVTKEQVKDVPFTTVANLVTALFMEL